MAKLYRVYFRTVDREYNPDKKIAKKRTKVGPDLKVTLSEDGSLTVLEEEIKKYWEYGDGISKLEWAGELDDSYLKPILAEPDFVDNAIKSKKNGEILGYQG